MPPHGLFAAPPREYEGEPRAQTRRTLGRREMADCADPGEDLCLAAARGDGVSVASQLARGCDPSLADARTRTPLMHAVQSGHAGVVDMLVAAGACVNACTEDGVTALSRSAARGDLTITRALLGAGAQASFQDGAGNTPLFHAAARGHASTVEALLAAGAAVACTNHKGQTAAAVARMRGQVDVALLLDAAGDGLESEDEGLGSSEDGGDGTPRSHRAAELEGGHSKGHDRNVGSAPGDNSASRAELFWRTAVRRCYVHPCGALLVALVVFGLPAGFLGLFFARGDVTIDISLQSFTAPDHPSSQRHDAYRFMTSHCQGVMGEGCLHCDRDEALKQHRRADEGIIAPSGGKSALHDRRRQTAWTLTLVYQTEEGSMMEPEKVAVMQAVEQRLYAKMVERSQRRWNPTSVVRSLLAYLYPGNTWINEGQPPPTQAEITDRIRYAASTTPVKGYPDPLGENIYTRAGEDMTSANLVSKSVVAQVYIPEEQTEESMAAYTDPDVIGKRHVDGVTIVYNNQVRRDAHSLPDNPAVRCDMGRLD